MPVSPTVPTARNRRHHLVARAGALVLVAGLLSACGSDDSDDDASNTTSTTVAVLAGETTTTPAPGAGGDTSSGEDQANGDSESGGGQSAGSESGGDAPTPAPAPTIASFTMPDDIDCHNGNAQTFTASWTTTDAVRVTISIDGPGVYNEYPANAETDLPFNCSAPHTFLLTAYGADGQSATSSVTLHPRNVQTETGDDTEDV